MIKAASDENISLNLISKPRFSDNNRKRVFFYEIIPQVERGI